MVLFVNFTGLLSELEAYPLHTGPSGAVARIIHVIIEVQTWYTVNVVMS